MALTLVRERPYGIRTWRGFRFDNRTIAMLQEAERRLGHTLILFQGSFNGGTGKVSASAGTHDGGGAVDLWCPTLPAHIVVRALRDVGFAAWHRTAIPGLWGEHIHAIAIGDHLASPAAKQQEVDFSKGLDGLVDNAKDTNPYRPSPPVVFNFLRWRKERNLYRQVQTLNHTIWHLLAHRHYDNIRLAQLRGQRRLKRQELRALRKKGL